MNLDRATVCVSCKRFRNITAKGLCESCYRKDRAARAGGWRVPLTEVKAPAAVQPATPVKPSDDLTARLLRLTKHPISFEALCDRLDLAPSKLRELITRTHVRLLEGNDHVQLSPGEQIRTVQDTTILPDSGTRQQIGVISDLHLGSKYCLRSQLRDCVTHMYARGIREILIPGDLLDGCYKHGVFELSHTGLTEQTQDLAETLPLLTGLTYHAITGNHDHTFAELTGVDVGAFIVGQFAKAGRKDLTFYGDCGAFVKIRGAVIHLWHPLGGMSYAKSYKLQKQIEKYGSGEKPDILIGGHVHQFALVEDRGVFGMLCPTFQASGSAFSKRLGGQPALGGLIVSWELAGVDLVRNFAVERRRYYEVELPTKIST
jgi:UDP-2,3-diacylglucosamine pyrophosphatase LpxH